MLTFVCNSALKRMLEVQIFTLKETIEINYMYIYDLRFKTVNETKNM